MIVSHLTEPTKIYVSQEIIDIDCAYMVGWEGEFKYNFGGKVRSLLQMGGGVHSGTVGDGFRAD